MVNLIISRSWFDACRKLTGDQRLVADALLELLERSPALPLVDGDHVIALTGAVRASQQDLAELANVSRMVVRKALAALAKAGAIDLAFDDGPRGSVIAIRGATWVRDDVAGALVATADAAVGDVGPVVRDLIERLREGIPASGAGRSPVASQVNSPVATDGETPRASQVDSPVGERRNRAPTTGNPQASGREIRVEKTHETEALHDLVDKDLTSKPHNGDQDPCSTRGIAAGSEQSPTSLEADPKSDHLPSAPKGLPEGGMGGQAASVTAIELAPEPKRTPKKKTASKQRSVRSLKLAELHPASVELADKLRDSCLRQQPGNTCGKVTPWNESGLRLQWAQTIEALVDKVSDGPLDAPRVRQAIERALAWLPTDQGCSDPKYRIIVLSAAALAEKWDRIAARCAPQPSRKPAEITLHASTTRKLAVAPPEISRHRIDSGVPE